jgi:hypothetical protein
MSTARRVFPAPDDLFAVDDDRKAPNERRAAEAGLEPCTHCGRGVKPGRGFMTVVVGGGSGVVHPDLVTEDDERDGGYMGAWVLGSTCARSVAPEALKRWDGWN